MQPNASHVAIAALSESHALASEIAREAHIPMLPIEERSFDGGEFKLRPLESVRGRHLFVLQSLAGTAEAPLSLRLVRLLFLLHCLRDGGADPRVLVLPYLTFARKDRRTQIRDPVSTRYIAELLEVSGPHALIGLDVHNPAAFDNAFRIPTIHLSALPMFADHFRHHLSRHSAISVVSPDVGGIKRAQIFTELLAARLGQEVTLAFVEKRRARGLVSGGALAGDLTGRTAIILDDLCASGGTLTRAAQACHDGGAAEVYAAVTHAPLPAGIAAVLASPLLAGMTVTDSVGTPPGSALRGDAHERLVVLSVAGLVGQTLRRLAAGEPISPLLERWPPEPPEHARLLRQS